MSLTNNEKGENMDNRNGDKGNKEFKKIEEMLYNYFNKEKRIDALKHQIKILDKQIEKIDSDLRTCNITLEEESSSPSFDERVQTSSDGMSYAEREVMRITDLKIKRKHEKELEKEELLGLIDKIELDNAILEYNIQSLNSEWYKLIELKYKFKKKEQQISEELNISQSQVNRIKQKIIADINRWEDWKRTK